MASPDATPESPYSSSPAPTTGGTVRPVYGERRPVMYHLFETEMKSISEFNSESLRWFSIGSFCLNFVIAIVVDYAYGGSPLSEFGAFCLHKAAPFLGVLSIASFAFGGWVLYQKKTLIDLIKSETRTESNTVRQVDL